MTLMRTPQGTETWVQDSEVAYFQSIGWTIIRRQQGPKSIWLDFLEDNPEIAYAAYRPQAGSQNFTDYWARQQGQVMRDWQKQLGSEVMSGRAPSTRWYTFLSQYPWTQRYLGLSPEARGVQESLYAPRMRWNI